MYYFLFLTYHIINFRTIWTSLIVYNFQIIMNISLISLSAVEWGCAPSLLVVCPEAAPLWGLQTFGGAPGDLQEKDLCQHVTPRTATAPVPMAGHWWPMSPQETLRHSQAGLAQSITRIRFESFSSFSMLLSWSHCLMLCCFLGRGFGLADSIF